MYDLPDASYDPGEDPIRLPAEPRRHLAPA